MSSESLGTVWTSAACRMTGNGAVPPVSFQAPPPCAGMGIRYVFIGSCSRFFTGGRIAEPSRHIHRDLLQTDFPGSGNQLGMIILFYVEIINDTSGKTSKRLPRTAALPPSGGVVYFLL